MSSKLSRRNLLRVLAIVVSSIGLGKLLDGLLDSEAQGLADESTYLPLISKMHPEPPTATSTFTPTATSTSTPTATSTLDPDTPTSIPDTPTSTPDTPTSTPDTPTAASETPTSTSTPDTPTSTPDTPTATSETPTATATTSAPPTDPRVVHVHHQGATSWNGQTDFWNYVNQTPVNSMTDHGLMALTGAANVTAAWAAILPNYQAGQTIAIKVNFNNSKGSCNDIDGQIDAIIEPVNALVRGLTTFGVAESDIWIYDASRRVPDRFVNACQFSNVVFKGVCRVSPGWSSTDPHATVSFANPPSVPSPPVIRISDVLVDTDYLINMPIMKPHGLPGATLTFKNHFGNIDRPFDLHRYLLNGADYTPDWNPLVDIYLNPHIAQKTVLVVGDALVTAHNYNIAPALWTTFGNQLPNSLFFSTDPVAIDCVMSDFLDAEVGLPAGSDDSLVLASNAGLGFFERGDPWGSGYTQLDYIKIELGT